MIYTTKTGKSINYNILSADRVTRLTLTLNQDEEGQFYWNPDDNDDDDDFEPGAYFKSVTDAKKGIIEMYGMRDWDLRKGAKKSA